jgi:hypothetical protein
VWAAAALLFAAGLAAAQAPTGAPAGPPAGAPGARAGGPPSLDFFKTDDPRSNPFTRAQIEGWKSTDSQRLGPLWRRARRADTLPTNTIFYPKDLATVKGKLPILSFANGACSGQPLELTEVYTELASHGIFRRDNRAHWRDRERRRPQPADQIHRLGDRREWPQRLAVL